MNENRQLQILGVLLWAQCLFVGSTFRTLPITCGFATIITLVILGSRKFKSGSPTKSSQRWWKTLLACLGFILNFGIVAQWRATSQLSEELNYVYLVIDSLAHTSLTFGFFLWLKRPTSGHPAMIPFGCIVALMACAAGGASSSLTAQSAIALTICLGFILGCEVTLRNKHGFGAISTEAVSDHPSSKWIFPTFSLFVLSALMMGTSGVANSTNMILPTIQSKLQEELKTSFNAMAEESYVGGTRYVRGSELGSLRKHMLGDPAEVAVQAYCQLPPGYLRGTVFDRYFRGRWVDSGSFEFQRYYRQERIPDQPIPATSIGTTELNVSLREPLSRFELIQDPPQQIISVEVLSDPSKGSLIFTPLNTYWIEASSREISYTAHGVIRAGIDVRRPYVAGVGQQLPMTPLKPEIEDSTLRLPEQIASRLQEYGSDLIENGASTREIATAISEHFQSEYGYSLTTNIDRPRRSDPIEFFLDNQHDAHCEYFASATVLLLRSLGVHSRYVTGYVVDEASEEESSLWLGRNRDAHAWAEAYDEETQQWFAVESTPGRKYQTIEPEQLNLNAADAAGNLIEDQSGIDDGWLLNAIDWAASVRVSEPIVILFRVAQIPLFIILTIYLWKRHRKARQPEAKAEIRARKMLKKVDRLMGRLELHRAPSETLCHFADRISRTANTDRFSMTQQQSLARCAQWYRSFAEARYQGLAPEPLSK